MSQLDKSAVSLEEMAQALKAADNFVICGHVSPDGDCLGSELGLAWALRALGKKVVCLRAKDEPVEFGLRFLPGVEDVIPACEYEGSVESFITVDVPTAKRMGVDAAELHVQATRTFTIDHHLSQEPLSHLNYVDASAPAAALIIWKLIPYLGIKPDVQMATCCYVGLITDCGRFTYQNTTADALSCAAEMLAVGVDPAKVAAEVYENRSRASLALERRVIEHCEYLNGGQVLISYLKRSDFVETNSTKVDAESMIDLLRSVRGVQIACMLREQDGQVRGSLRSKDSTDVAKIAAQFEGGGHKAAAGFTYKGSLADARRDLAEILGNL